MAHYEQRIERNSLRFAFPPFSLLVVKRGFMAQDVMVMLRKTVGFVADVLQQTQAVGVAAESQWFGVTRQIDFFIPFGE